jgi:hypothetical protein
VLTDTWFPSESFVREAKSRGQIENSDIDPKGFPLGGPSSLSD